LAHSVFQPGKGTGLTIKQKRIAAELGRGLTPDEVCQLFNIKEKALKKLLQEEAFCAARNESEARYMEELYPLATRELEKELTHPDPWIRANAVRIVRQVQQAQQDRAAHNIVVVFGSMPAPGSPVPVQAIPVELAEGEVK
jgi:hypothetical protein